ncbi:MAG: SAM-dependent chlorinase/fluorinase [Nitrospirae bacterium]|nr:SAM-dependent chlorinase/fluorinase [Nitrospirota bacterium]
MTAPADKKRGPARPVITLTTDFGHDDPFAGVMKGVILRTNPEAVIVDLTHGIRPFDIEGAAMTIGMNCPYFPDDTVHVVVVDPGVGSERKPIIVSAGRQYFIGPDNGVFSWLYRAHKDSVEVFHITSSEYFLSGSSPTFQGRDLFGPVAAWLSKGVAPDKFGRLMSDYRRIDLSVPLISKDGGVTGEVVHIDRFGNAVTNIPGADIGTLLKNAKGVTVSFRGGDISVLKFYEEGNPGILCSLINSSGFLELFVSRGDAASLFNISKGDPVTVTKSRS